MDISGKTIVVTGAASGLGAATAAYLSARGAYVVGIDRNANESVIECDITSSDAVKKVIDSQKELHAVINCAGIIHGARIVGKKGAMPLEDFSRIVQVNLIGTFNVLRLCAEKMSVQAAVNEVGERGVIINTASVAAFEGQLGQISYSASKGGVASMTLPAARELSRFGIRVMTIAPGVMETPMVAGMTPELQQALCADVPFPKKLGKPAQFAALCAHIIENDYLNGSTIRLDGALRMQ
ncbi:MAG: SDR family NAD(P)-dependent oxidoreductase [Coxiellaceae bacterium]|nr:SDR family NAD(P)-dependent oxidoreductase [Coxiellaceae bacterium]